MNQQKNTMSQAIKTKNGEHTIFSHSVHFSIVMVHALQQYENFKNPKVAKEVLNRERISRRREDY